MDWLFRLLGSMLSFFESLTGGYALALLLYALVFKIVFIPFSIKQQKNQIAMAKLAPKIEVIKAKYKGRTDQPTMQKQQQEIMDLQQKEGYSPFSGCLPLLIQLPLIILLYQVIQNPLSYIAKPVDADASMKDVVASIREEFPKEGDKEYTEIELINKIYSFIENEESSIENRDDRIAYIEELGLDYESIPNFNLFGVNLAASPMDAGFSILWIIPVLAAAAQWVSMWLTRKFNGNPMQAQGDAQTQASMKMMDLIFPGMTLFMAFSFSGMLGLYWTFQALLGLLQSFILSRVMPLPKFTEEEMKAMRKAQKEAEKAQKEAAKAQPKYRSLHYIDDDDYDILPNAPGTEEKKEDNPMDGNMPEIKD